jgi:hypothetical protein
MSCAEIFTNRPIGTVRRVRFSQLHYDGKSLIRGWFDRAWVEFDRQQNEVFEPFIFLWFAFNGWASCVTNKDRDFEIIDALAADEGIGRDFTRIINDQTLRLAVNAKRLAELLPIFDAKTLTRRLQLVPVELGDDRRAHVLYYIEQGINRYEPACWHRHMQADGEIPVDWPHLLKPIYKIRCNLFHGQKSAHSEMDQRIVRAAFLTLGHFLKDANYFEIGEPPRWF